MADDPLPISLVAHTVFCPRRAWLEVNGEQVDSGAIQTGLDDARAVDAPESSRAGRVRGFPVASARLGIAGVCDTLIANDDGWELVEHKAAPARRRATVTEAHRTQLALQTLCLTEMGRQISRWAVWFSTSRTKVPVELVEDDYRRARAAVESTRRVVGSLLPPPPLTDDPRCVACSHVGVCLPDEIGRSPEPRSIAVRDPVARVVHLTVPGSRARTRSGRLQVVRAGDLLSSAPIEQVDAVVVHGNVDISAALIRELLLRNCPVLWLTGGGRLAGWAVSAQSPNAAARHRQHLVDAATSQRMAAEMVRAKIANQATLLRRHGDARGAVDRLRGLQRRAQRTIDHARLLGFEGEAASLYFTHFESMFAAATRTRFTELFGGRSRRPSGDPVNAALNYAYGLLLADGVRAVVATGLDVSAGFLHSPGRNKPGLALDLIEEFRAPVGDAVVVGAFNNGELRPASFSNVVGEWRLTPQGRRALAAAYDRRVNTEFTHPEFGYRVSWRRALEVQARMVLGVVDGTRERYVGIRIR